MAKKWREQNVVSSGRFADDIAQPLAPFTNMV